MMFRNKRLRVQFSNNNSLYIEKKICFANLPNRKSDNKIKIIVFHDLQSETYSNRNLFFIFLLDDRISSYVTVHVFLFFLNTEHIYL